MKHDTPSLFPPRRTPPVAEIRRAIAEADAPRAHGTIAAEACASAAERRSGFDREKAAEFVLDYLRRQGPTSGESLTNQAVAAGHSPHDLRAFGVVFAGLKRRGLIVEHGYCKRARGNGTSGGVVWRAVA